MNIKEPGKEIGIITYHRAINYGAILQAYALLTKIRELGVKCVILDYRNKKLEERHKKRTISDCRSFKDIIKYMLLSKIYNRRYKKFRDFANRHFVVTAPLYTLDDLKEIEKDYSRFITGSDQVWNYMINDLDVAYFLDFTADGSKKASYAASFGVSEIPDEYKQKYSALLSDFDSILVREKQGAIIIKDLLSRESQFVLDPILLLTKDEWANLAEDKSIMNKKYILVYAFGGSRFVKDLALNISRKTGYKVVWISSTYKMSKGIKYVKTAGPEEFLGLIKNAEYVVTNSFHGTAFSINMNKHFFTEVSLESKVKSRIEDMLDLFELRNRVINSSKPSVIKTPIVYTKVNQILEAEREKSLAMLKYVISK